MPNTERLCLIAGIGAKDDPLRRFLRLAGRAEERSERSRLLYVAATRARRRLYLLASLRHRDSRPHPDSLLALLDTPVAARVSTPEDSSDGSEQAEPIDGRPLRELPLERLRSADDVPWPPSSIGANQADPRLRPEFEWAHPAAVQVGTLIHRELQRLCVQAALAGKPVQPQAAIGRFRRELSLLGVEPEDLGAAAERVSEALERVWSDPVGRNILHPWPEAWSELGMSWRGQDRIEHLRIDRSFVDAKGLRWIVDYKTGRHLGGDVEAFLDSEVARYEPQLERYAEAVAAVDQRPIRVGLYFPLLQRLRDWVPEIAAGR